jgi:hypothetical protein
MNINRKTATKKTKKRQYNIDRICALYYDMPHDDRFVVAQRVMLHYGFDIYQYQDIRQFCRELREWIYNAACDRCF